MKAKIKAIFKGQDGSCGYRKDKEYTLKLEHQSAGRGLITITEPNENDGFCEYNSIIAFLRNWNNIRVIN